MTPKTLFFGLRPPKIGLGASKSGFGTQKQRFLILTPQKGVRGIKNCILVVYKKWYI